MLIKNVLLKILKIGLYVAPLSIFFFAHQTVFPMATLKFSIFSIVIEVLFVAWIWLLLSSPEYRVRKNIIIAAVLILLNIATIVSMFGLNPVRSFWSTPDRMTGLFMLWHFCAYFLMLYSLRREISWKKYLSFLFIESLIVSLFVIVQVISPEFFLSASATRPGSFLGNPAYLAGYLLFTIFLGAWLGRESIGWQRYFFWGATAYEVVILFVTDTRGAILAFAAGVLALLVIYGKRKAKPATYILVALLVFGGAFFVTRSAPMWQRIPGFARLAQLSTAEGGAANRLIAWNIALKGFTQAPILGAGWENFKYVVDKNYNPVLFRNGSAETYWDQPHNAFLEYLATTGIFGFLAYLGVFYAAFYVILRKATREFRPFAIAILVAYLVQNLFFFDTFGTYLMLFVFLAYIASLDGDGDLVKGESSGTGAGVASIAPRRSASHLKHALVALIGAGAVIAIGINVNVVYANHLEHSGINYFINRMPAEGISNFQAALQIPQPGTYLNDLRLRYLQTVSQAVSQMEIPDAKPTVQSVIDEFKKAIITDPLNYFNHYALADAKVSFGLVSNTFYNGSESDVGRAMELSPDRQLNYFVYSKIRYLQFNPQGSADMMKKAVDLDPGSPSSHYYYALTLINLDQLEKAGEEFEKAAELGFVPTDATEAKQLGDHFGDAEQYDKSLAYYQQAIDFNPNDVDAHLKKGLVYMFKGESQMAKPYMEKVLMLLPDFKSLETYPKFKPYFESLNL